MAFTAAQVMKRASTILQDADAIRWTPVELCDWLNEALRAIVAIKPNAKAGNVILTLAAGTKQTLPEQYTILSRVLRNIGPTPGNAPGKAIRTLAKRDILDAQIPGWHDPAVLPATAAVSYVWQDLMALREFWVAPANDGNGRIEVTVGMIPTPVTAPSNPLDIDAYVQAVDLPDLFQPIILDMILYRAFSKDSAAPDAAQRAGAHMQSAASGLEALSGGQNAVSLAAAFAAAG